MTPLLFIGMENGMEEPLLDPQDLADYLKMPVPTIYAWRSRGKGPRGIRVGRHLRFRRIDVDAWVEANSTPTTAA